MKVSFMITWFQKKILGVFTKEQPQDESCTSGWIFDDYASNEREQSTTMILSRFLQNY